MWLCYHQRDDGLIIMVASVFPGWFKEFFHLTLYLSQKPGGVPSRLQGWKEYMGVRFYILFVGADSVKPD